MGTVQYWVGNTIRVSRMIGGGTVSDFMARVEKFNMDVHASVKYGTVNLSVQETEIESTRSGVCCVRNIRCQSKEDITLVCDEFRRNGWKVK
jgi:hypothetical protein